jgi:hypothetical protein
VALAKNKALDACGNEVAVEEVDPEQEAERPLKGDKQDLGIRRSMKKIHDGFPLGTIAGRLD